MASYLSNTRNRDTITLMLSNAEASAILVLASHALDHGTKKLNPQSTGAAERAIDALNAALNKSARRAGWFDA
jgi:hypothetical protein